MKIIIRYCTLILCLCLAGTARSAEPLTALLGLYLVTKITQTEEPRKQEPSLNWDNMLSASERGALQRMNTHPAVAKCRALARDRDPIASYHLRKIADFADKIDQGLVRTGRIPQVSSLDYEWPAKAFRWCGRQAGVFAADDSLPLTRYAYGIVRVVRGTRTLNSRVAATSNF